MESERVFWTKLGIRFTKVGTHPGTSFNWLFLPGGPGLGSEYLFQLTRNLGLPGDIWHLDLPEDGSNRSPGIPGQFELWLGAIVEAVSTFQNTILVAHSTGAMLALSSNIREADLTGFVIMNSAPDHSWREKYSEYTSTHPLDTLEPLVREHIKNPTDHTLKSLTLSSAPYLFTEKGLTKDLSWLEKLPFNQASCSWCEENFDSIYIPKWIPESLPTL